VYPIDLSSSSGYILIRDGLMKIEELEGKSPSIFASFGEELVEESMKVPMNSVICEMIIDGIKNDTTNEEDNNSQFESKIEDKGSCQNNIRSFFMLGGVQTEEKIIIYRNQNSSKIIEDDEDVLKDPSKDFNDEESENEGVSSHLFQMSIDFSPLCKLFDRIVALRSFLRNHKDQHDQEGDDTPIDVEALIEYRAILIEWRRLVFPTLNLPPPEKRPLVFLADMFCDETPSSPAAYVPLCPEMRRLNTSSSSMSTVSSRPTTSSKNDGSAGEVRIPFDQTHLTILASLCGRGVVSQSNESPSICHFIRDAFKTMKSLE